jgi:hypothetical protein
MGRPGPCYKQYIGVLYNMSPTQNIGVLYETSPCYKQYIGVLYNLSPTQNIGVLYETSPVWIRILMLYPEHWCVIRVPGGYKSSPSL